jgi:hypothetical protein
MDSRHHKSQFAPFHYSKSDRCLLDIFLQSSGAEERMMQSLHIVSNSPSEPSHDPAERTKEVLTVDEKVVIWHILAKRDCSTTVVTQVENSGFDPKPRVAFS